MKLRSWHIVFLGLLLIILSSTNELRKIVSECDSSLCYLDKGDIGFLVSIFFFYSIPPLLLKFERTRMSGAIVGILFGLMILWSELSQIAPSFGAYSQSVARLSYAILCVIAGLFFFLKENNVEKALKREAGKK